MYVCIQNKSKERKYSNEYDDADQRLKCRNLIIIQSFFFFVLLMIKYYDYCCCSCCLLYVLSLSSTSSIKILIFSCLLEQLLKKKGK